MREQVIDCIFTVILGVGSAIAAWGIAVLAFI